MVEVFCVSLWRTHGKKSGLHQFREHFIASQKRLGVQRDWLSQEAWAIVKAEFHKLSPEETNLFKVAAQESNKSVNMKPLQKDSTWQLVDAKHASTASSSTAVACSLGSDSDPYQNQVLNTSFLSCDGQQLKQCMGSVFDLLQHLRTLQKNFATSPSSDLSPWPISEASILSALLGLKARGIRLRDAIKGLAKTCERTAGPRSDDPKDQFPKKVMYARNCQFGVCGCSGFDRVRLQSHLIMSLNNLAAFKYKKPNDMVLDDVLLSFTVTKPGATLLHDFFLVTAVAFKGGVQRPTQSYIKLRAGDSFEHDQFLELVPSNFIEALDPWPSPLNQAFVGCLKTWSTAELAAYLIGSEECFDLTVRIQKHQYVDMSRSVLKLVGIPEDWGTVDNVRYFDTKRVRQKQKPEVTMEPIEIDMLDFFQKLRGGPPALSEMKHIQRCLTYCHRR